MKKNSIFVKVIIFMAIVGISWFVGVEAFAGIGYTDKVNKDIMPALRENFKRVHIEEISLISIAGEEDNNDKKGNKFVTKNSDLNGDGKINYKDLAILGSVFNLKSGDAAYNAKADLNSDGKIDNKDKDILSAFYGQTQGGINPKNPDLNGDGKINYKDLAILGSVFNLKSGDAAYNAKADLNSDGKIDNKDKNILSAFYGQTQMEEGNWWEGMDVNQIVSYLDDLSLTDAASALTELANADVDLAAQVVSSIAIGYDEIGADGAMTRVVGDPQKAADLLGAMKSSIAARIVASDKMTAATAAAVLSKMDIKSATAILKEPKIVAVIVGSPTEFMPTPATYFVSKEKAAAILTAMGADKAAVILNFMASNEICNAGICEVTVGVSVDPKRAADILGVMDTKTAARVVANTKMDIRTAATILSKMDSKQAAKILSADSIIYYIQTPGPNDPKTAPIVSVDKAAGILSGMNADKAADILKCITETISIAIIGGFNGPERAADIVGAMDAKVAANIFASDNIDVKTAVVILQKLQVTNEEAVIAILDELTAVNPDKAEQIKEGLTPNEPPLPPTVISIQNPDITGDGVVNFKDLAMLGRAFNSKVGDAAYNAKADLNSDGVINDKDNSILAAFYGATSAGEEITILNPDINGDGTVNFKDLAILGSAFNSKVGDSAYNAKADLNSDGVINDKDGKLLGAFYEGVDAGSRAGRSTIVEIFKNLQNKIYAPALTQAVTTGKGLLRFAPVIGNYFNNL